jgi:hypothetical protein
MSSATSNHPAAQLTVAEALVLREPNKQQGRAALKLTLMDLLTRGALVQRREQRKGLLGRFLKTEYLQLAPDAAQRAPDRPHVRAVLDALATVGAANGATIGQIVAQARKSFGTDLSRFQTKHVLPALIERGLLEAYKARVLLLFSATRYRHTPAGAAALREVEERIAQARAIPDFLDRDPAQAAALALALGSTLLLVDELKPQYSRLSAALRERAADSTGTGDDLSGIGASPADFDAGFDFSLDGFDALDGGLDAFDSGFDAADSGGDGGDGGGDGGE